MPQGLGWKEVRMMGKTVGIGHQDFEVIRSGNYFYVDKTHFIKEWWEGGDSVTLIARPRRFGKTLNMSMAETFFFLSNMQAKENCLRGLPSGRMKNIETFREASLSLACPLPM